MAAQAKAILTIQPFTVIAPTVTVQ